MDLNNLPINKKHLIVFDFDNTILKGNTAFSIVKQFLDLDESLQIKKRFSDNENFVSLFRNIFSTLKNKNYNIQAIKKLIEELPLNEGFHDLFLFLRQENANFEVIIISATVSLFIEWILDKNQLSSVFSQIFCQNSQLDEDCLISIRQFHNHDCRLCNSSQCKGTILREYLENRKNQIDKVVYVGDGENDYCPALSLNDNDVLFPREKWGLHKKLEDGSKEDLRCRTILWSSGEVIKQELCKIIGGKLNTKF
jgi:pyridoxal phosphate phosphatase PHOSPHO2